jgi:hypothetical protein
MAAKSNSCFWLANVKQIFFSETARAKLNHKNELLLVAMFVGQMEPYEDAL